MLALIDKYRRAARDNIVDPSSIVDIQSHTSMRGAYAEATILYVVHTSRLIENGMEKVVSEELRPVPARIPRSKGKTA